MTLDLDIIRVALTQFVANAEKDDYLAKRFPETRADYLDRANKMLEHIKTKENENEVPEHHAD